MNILNDIEQLTPRLRDAQPFMVMLDFDGTLVPIQEHAEACYLKASDRTLLRTLQHKPNTHVAIVSGRSLADLKPRVGIPNIAYAGNHGLEIEYEGPLFIEPTAFALQHVVSNQVGRLQQALQLYQGVWVENKGLSASIHFRQAEPSQTDQIIQTIHDTLADVLANHQLILREGKCVREIRPNVAWHKGHAIHWLRQQWADNETGLIIYIGDDTTDEDAFAMLRDHLTVHVGTGPTLAQYRVSTVEEVYTLLKMIVDLR